MALCESQLEVIPPQLKSEESSPAREEQSPETPLAQPNGEIFQLDKVPGNLPLAVDYRSPVSHFIPPAVEMFAHRPLPKPEIASPDAGEPSDPHGTPSPIKRKRGRPRVDKTSPEYLAKSAARKQAKIVSMMNHNTNSNSSTEPGSGEKRKRGRPRVDKTSPEYLAKKRAREIEALEKKAKRDFKRRSTAARPVILQATRSTKMVKTSPRQGRPPKKLTVIKKATPRKSKLTQKPNVTRKLGEKNVVVRRTIKLVRKKKEKDSGASSSNDGTQRAKRKYTKRQPVLNNDGSPMVERVKGKRGRPRKIDIAAANIRQPQQAKIRVRSNLMPNSAETINLDSDEEPDLGSPSQQSDSLSLDENLRALRYIHEKYANIDKDDQYEAHLLAANFKKGPQRNDDDEVLSVRSSEGRASVKELGTRVEKLEDSSNSDSDSSSSSGSSSSGSSSSSSSGSSSSSDSSDTESDTEKPTNNVPAPVPTTPAQNNSVEDDRSYGAWSSYSGAQTDSDSDSDPEKNTELTEAQRAEQDEISESDNESPDKSFQCHICRKWYSTRVTLKIHRRVHQRRADGNSRSKTRSSDRYECDCCNETFSRREKLWEHKAEAHRGSMTVRCEVCRKCFEDDAELASHDKLHTPDERAGRCADCGLTFPRYELLRRHRSNAHANRLPHACAHCGKRFSHAHSLTRHLHNHAKQLYRCVVCKASFARADQLAEHLNSHLDNYKRLKP